MSIMIYKEKTGLKNLQKIMPYYLLVLTACSKWLLEGILGTPLVELVILGFALFLYIATGRSRVQKISLVWLLYIFNIFFSVIFHDPSIGKIGRVCVMVCITLFLILENYNMSYYVKIYELIIKLAFCYGFFVFLQFILKDKFNQIYFPSLISVYNFVANHYFRQGYYFGLMFNPHEICYLLAISCVALIFIQMLGERKSFWKTIGCIILFFLMLLTQKKGVIFLSFLSFLLVVCIMYASKKQWGKIIEFTVVIVLLLLIFIRYIQTHTDNVLFYRVIQFIMKLQNNQNFDSGRGALQQFAIYEFNNHKWFGIGWKNFNSLTTNYFGYKSGHEVNCDYLQWLCETGIVGFFMNITPVIVMIYRTIRVCKNYVKYEKNVKIKWIVLIAIFSQFFTVTYAFIEIPFYDILIFTFYIISCIVINAAYLNCKQFC